MKLPTLVYQMCTLGGLLAGSVARQIAGEPDLEPQDFDVLVPWQHWDKVSLIIPPDAKPNRFGGWKFMDGDDEIDVWPDTVQNYLTKCKVPGSAQVVLVDFIANRIFRAELML